MRLTRIRWWRYRIPFRTPFTTAHGVLTQRGGVLLEVTSDAGVRGMGEIAPLPGFGGSVEATWQQVPTIAAFLLEHAPEGPCALRSHIANRWPAALRCGIETALLDIAAQGAERTLAAFLGSSAPASVPVNATVAAADTETAVRLSAAAVAAGFGAVKLKVGASGSLRDEVERVARVRAAIGPAANLRLDANEAWTQEEAIATIRACEQHRLEWVEQPVAAGDIAGMAAVRRAVGTPLAADESVTGAEAVRALLTAEAADVLILKPTLTGGPAATLGLAELARDAGVESIVTTALETGIGVAAAAHSAAALGPALHACGLATAALLEDDLLTQPLRVEHGRLLMPTGMGLSVSLDQEKLRHYTIASGEATAGR